MCVQASAGAAAATAPTTAPQARGPFLLVTLPSLGTVTWTCDAAARRPSYGLGYRASPRFATTLIELRIAGRVLTTRRIHPGRGLRFAARSARRQELLFVQGTGAGTLRARVSVDFAPLPPVTYCAPYAPPRLVVHVSRRE
jgi:hypothetical protein